MEANYFTILYWFCHTSTWICHRCTRVPNPEPPSHLPAHIISLDHPRAPAPSILYPVSNVDWQFVSYMIVYMFVFVLFPFCLFSLLLCFCKFGFVAIICVEFSVSVLYVLCVCLCFVLLLSIYIFTIFLGFCLFSFPLIYFSSFLWPQLWLVDSRLPSRNQTSVPLWWEHWVQDAVLPENLGSIEYQFTCAILELCTSTPSPHSTQLPIDSSACLDSMPNKQQDRKQPCPSVDRLPSNSRLTDIPKHPAYQREKTQFQSPEHRH